MFRDDILKSYIGIRQKYLTDFAVKKLSIVFQITDFKILQHKARHSNGLTEHSCENYYLKNYSVEILTQMRAEEINTPPFIK